MHRLPAPLALAAAAALAACSRPAPPAAPASDVPAAPTQSTPPSGDTAQDIPAFANKIWKVAQSSAVDSGTYYVFLDDGSMLVTSRHATPEVGSWRYSGEVLTMVEEGLPHAATVLQATPDTLAIRIAGPGQPARITFVPVTAP